MEPTLDNGWTDVVVQAACELARHNSIVSSHAGLAEDTRRGRAQSQDNWVDTKQLNV